MQRTRHLIICACLVGTTAGCASPPPLDTTELTEITLASPEELYGGARSQWPTMRIDFQSRQILFDPDLTAPQIRFYLCDESGEDRRFQEFTNGTGVTKGWVIWQGRVVARETAEEIKAKLQKDQLPQKYSIYFNYAYGNKEPNHPNKDHVTLLPIPGDLCLAFFRYDMVFGLVEGRPLRVSKSRVNAAVGGLPRSFSSR